MNKTKYINLDQCSVIQRLAVFRFGHTYLTVNQDDYQIVFYRYDGQIYRETIKNNTDYQSGENK